MHAVHTVARQHAAACRGKALTMPRRATVTTSNINDVVVCWILPGENDNPHHVNGTPLAEKWGQLA